MNKLSLFCYVDKDFKDNKLEDFVNEMNRHYPVNVIIKEFDGEDAEWTIRNDKMYLSDEYNAKMCQPVYDKYFNGVDIVGIFIDEKNWKNTKKRLLGTKFGKRHNDYYVFSCKLWRNYEGTGEHEVLHAIDDYIKRYLGIRIETLFKVKDFDSDIVHGKEYWKKGYFYDDVWKKLAPVLSVAIKRKRSQNPVLSLTSVLQRAVESQYLASESVKDNMYVPKNFIIEELVSEKIYKRHGDGSWRFLDERVPRFLQWLRDRTGRKIRVNDWKWGGKFHNRCFDAGEFRKNGTSQHNHGRAVDFDVEGMTPKQVQRFVADNIDSCPVKDMWIEGSKDGKDLTWNHFDFRVSEIPGIHIFHV